MNSQNFLDTTIVSSNVVLEVYKKLGAKKTTASSKLKLTAPWITYYRQLKALFAEDSEIKVIYDEDHATNNIFVDNPDKADAISTILPATATFGNIKVRNVVIPSNRVVEPVVGSVIERAFANNNAVSLIKIITSEFMSNPMTFVVFKNKTVQYYSDNAGSLDGITTTIYEDIARNIFGETGEYLFSTEKGEDVVSLSAPLGEWP